MGQECCQVATNQDFPPVKTLLIKESDFQLVPSFDLNHPLLKEKVPDLQSLSVFRNNQQNRYFIGSWKEGQANGQGTLYIPDHLLYQGNFNNATPEGDGQMIFLNKNEQYKGNFHEGKANGQGLYKNNAKKFTFQGQWKESKPQKGILMFDDNPNILKIQIENFETRIAHILYKDGRQYHGEIHKQIFVPQGQGKLHFLDGSSYNGEWKNGLMHGYGVYCWKDGSRYEGSYVEGKKEGNGVFYYTSGKQYIGMWANGKQQGQGKIITKDNQAQKQGIWKNGTFQKKLQTEQPKEQQNRFE